MLNGTIVSAAELSELLKAGDVLLIDAGRGRAAYDARHLAGARFADSNEHLSSIGTSTDYASGGRHPLPDLAQWCRTLGEWGVTPQTNVVVYDAQSGANAAARAWWMFRAIGHERVAVLDGGIAAADAAGIPSSSEPPSVVPAAPYPASRWLRPVVDIDAVDESRRDPRWIVLDVRSRERFAGLEEPIDTIAGHIPGAVNLPYVENLSDGTFKTGGELRAMYRELLGDVAPENLIVHCGSGVTACHTLLALEIAGLHGAALYVGSWSEWSRKSPPRPMARRNDG